MNDPKRILVVALGIPLLIAIGFGIKGAIDEGGEKNARMYNTAIQATETERFNYTIDSHQGKLLGYGRFTADAPVKFPEMNKSFTHVEKGKEEYTMHTREVCTEDSEGNESCHTETYYTWDYVGGDDLSTPTLTLHGRKYPSSTFDLGGYERSVDCSEFTAANTAGWFQAKNGCDGHYFYTDSDTRYWYRIVDTTFSAGFIADVSDGSLKALKGGAIGLQDKQPEQMVKDANDYHTPGIVFIWIWSLFAIFGMAALAYAWALNDEKWDV